MKAINCQATGNGNKYSYGYIGDMVLTKDASTLYAVDQTGFWMIVLDTRTNKIVRNIPTCRYPIKICMPPDEKRIYMANVSVFEYKVFT